MRVSARVARSLRMDPRDVIAAEPADFLILLASANVIAQDMANARKK